MLMSICTISNLDTVFKDCVCVCVCVPVCVNLCCAQASICICGI